MKRRILTFAAFWVAMALVAVPARRRPFVFRQPDGTVLTVMLVGDEYSHYYVSAEGVVLTEGEGGWLVGLGDGRKYIGDNLKFIGDISKFIGDIFVDGHVPDNEVLAGLGERGVPRRAPAGLGHYPTLGSPRELVLLVDYPDCRFSHEAEVFRRMLTEEGFADDGATGSALDYFSDQSRGLFRPEIEVVGPVTLPHPRAYYGQPTANMYDAQPWLMLTEAAPMVDGEVDFARFDNDGDGFVDNVFVFYAGEGQNDGGPLEAVWPHAANVWTYYGLDVELDGVRLGSYACTNEVTGSGRLTGIGTFVHEYSHVLGLPDLYSTQGAEGVFSPGAFEVMDSGAYNNEGRTPPNMSAYDREALGWVMAEPLTAPETVVMAAAAPSASLQLAPSGGGLEGAEGVGAPLHEPASGGGLEGAESAGGAEGGVSTVRRIATVKPEEYYLLENRQQEGWDAYLPAHGMLIWHIDYDARAWADNQVNVLAGHQRVDLVEADGVATKDTQDGDAFPGSRQTTAVNLLPWTGVPIEAAITEIRETPDGMVTFKYRGGGERIAAPVALGAEEVGPCGFTAVWTGVPAVTDYEVVVWRGQEAVALEGVTVAAAQAVGDGRWTATVGGLVPSTTYRYAVVARDGERRSPQSNVVMLTTQAPTFDMLAPTDLAASASEGGWTLTWTALEGAAAYEVETFGLRLVAPEVATLDFTGGLTALPEGWTTTSTQTSGMAGTYGEARPSLLLQPGEWLQSPAFEDGIADWSYWSQGETLASKRGADGTAQQLRITNTGERVAYVDDVAVSHGGRTEHVATETYGPAAGTTAVVAAPMTAQRYAQVRGVAADGRRSAWSAAVELPSLEGIEAVRADGARHGERYRIPPFISIGADGRKRTREVGM